MKYLTILILISFYACIATAIYVTGTAWPLFALLLAPSVRGFTED